MRMYIAAGLIVQKHKDNIEIDIKEKTLMTM
jgi:hypothetical protein